MPVYLIMALAAVLGAGLAVALLTGPVRTALIRSGVYDSPNVRSSHDTLKPRGGGVAVLTIVLPAWLAGAWAFGEVCLALPLVALTAGLAAVSFCDDVRGLAPWVRFPVQVAVVVLGLWVLDPGPVFQGWLPGWLDLAFASLAWLWFVNLYNFMDGIDGITGVETLSISAGLGSIGLLHALDGLGANAALPWLLAGAAGGFLVWNWAPSKIFLGDVGSVPLGYVLGALLLATAADGFWAVALILPAFYLADATITLFRRLLRGEKIWHAHREHAYQRAVHAGLSHGRVASWVAGLNVVLIACALVAALGAVLPALLLAAAAVLAVWLYFATRRPGDRG